MEHEMSLNNYIEDVLQKSPAAMLKQSDAKIKGSLFRASFYILFKFLNRILFLKIECILYTHINDVKCFQNKEEKYHDDQNSKQCICKYG